VSFDEKAATDAESFFATHLQHVEGKWAGRLFELLPWQRDLVRTVFGTKRADGTRQYRRVYVEVPRKSGKSSLAAGLALKLLAADGEAGGQIYGAASDRDQAGIIFRTAAAMVRRDKPLSSLCRVIDSSKRIVVEKTGSFYRAIPSDVAGSHGFNAHGIIFDELHTQPTRDLWDVLTTSTGARSQPLIIAFTTAGYDQTSICWELHDYALKVRDGVIEDDSFLPVIYAAGAEDDWTDPEVWKKANPSLGVTVQQDFLERECAMAKETPAFQNTFRRLYLNQWTQQEMRWLDLAVWDRCAGIVVPAELEGRECYGGLDLATSRDVAALELIFPPKGEEPYQVLSYFWIPEENMRDRENRDRVPYSAWARDGFLSATPGDQIDYAYIESTVLDLAQRFNIRELAYDRWGAVQIAQRLAAEGLTVVPVGQGFGGMAAATSETLAMIIGGKLAHGGNPVLRWMAANAVVKQDPAGNMRPDKGSATGRIDGIVALVMAVGRATVAEPYVEWAAS